MKVFNQIKTVKQARDALKGVPAHYNVRFINNDGQGLIITKPPRKKGSGRRAFGVFDKIMIRDMLLKGSSYRAIAKTVGCSTHAVACIRKKENIPLKKWARESSDDNAQAIN